jgi:hypothetical protein
MGAVPHQERCADQLSSLADGAGSKSLTVSPLLLDLNIGDLVAVVGCNPGRKCALDFWRAMLLAAQQPVTGSIMNPAGNRIGGVSHDDEGVARVA